MHYTVYKVTNKTNGKFYIGKHQTKNLDDGYMGSGKHLKYAIQKYGIENFTKEILHIFETEEEMNAKEKELVVLEENSYNLCDGGKGGFGYINGNESLVDKRDNILFKKMGYKANKDRMTDKQKNIRAGTQSKLLGVGIHDPKNKYNWNGKNHTEETKIKISNANKGRIPWNKGKPWKEWHPSAK